jgi:hypothetical protein
MAATTHAPETPGPSGPEHVEVHVNRDKTYVLVALFLAALTAAEVMTYAIPALFGGAGSIFMLVALLTLMAVKFWTVAGFFMHLRFDRKILTVVFYAGLILAGVVYIAVLATFRFWGTPVEHMVRR